MSYWYIPPPPPPNLNSNFFLFLCLSLCSVCLFSAEKSVEELPDHLTIVQRHHETTRANCEKVCKRIGSSFQGSGNEYEKRLVSTQLTLVVTAQWFPVERVVQPISIAPI